MTISALDLDFASLWTLAISYDQFVGESGDHRSLWLGIHRLARVPDWARAALERTSGPRHLLVLTEDWCGDAVNIMPVLARLAEGAAALDLRIIRRDTYPEVMDRYLTDGARAIPIVIALDEDFRELGHWGPRPTELQAWVTANREMPKPERYAVVRRWYARDRGESTLREVLAVIGQSSDVGRR